LSRNARLDRLALTASARVLTFSSRAFVRRVTLRTTTKQLNEDVNGLIGQIVQSNAGDLRPSFCARRFDQAASDEDQTLPSRRR